MEKILRKAGAERISKKALEELKITLLEMADKIARDAVLACGHAKRVTVKREDIQLVTRR
jgi:histone H3/H4